MAAVRCVILLAAVIAASASAQPRIGVLDLTSDTVSPSDLRLLSDGLRSELVATEQYQVIERERLEEILTEQGFQQSGCVATECVVEIGRLAGAEKMIAGTVGRISRSCGVALPINTA